MRVLMTTDTVGGVWTFTRELSEALLRAGQTVALVSFGSMPSPQQSAWADRMTHSFDQRFTYCPSAAPLEWMQENEHAFAAAVEVLFTTAAWFKPDVVHSNQYCFGSLRLDVPKLITAHSDVLSWAAACRPHGITPSEWLDRYCALVQSGLDGATAVVAPTKSMLDALTSNFQVPSFTSIIFNGRTLAQAVPGSMRFRQAVSVGRLWDDGKGLGTLSNIYPPVPILTAGDESFEGAYVCGAAPHVKRLGRLKEDELLELFHESSVYIVTSLYEPFGLAPLEAALCGCAIVARDLPSLREVWGDAALYFRTVDELSRLLHQLFASETELKVWQSAAQRQAEVFTVERMASSYLELYKELVSGAELHANVQEKWASNAA